MTLRIRLAPWIDTPAGVAILPPMKKATLIASLVFAVTVFAKSMAPVQEIALKDIDGKPTNLGAFAGKTILLVNVASKCGYTPQYEQLEAIHQKYKDRGFTVVGVPCNDFGAQEPGTNEDIKWNFGKFLIGPDGKVLKRWDSGVKPDSKEITEAIEASLAKR